MEFLEPASVDDFFGLDCGGVGGLLGGVERATRTTWAYCACADQAGNNMKFKNVVSIAGFMGPLTDLLQFDFNRDLSALSTKGAIWVKRPNSPESPRPLFQGGNRSVGPSVFPDVPCRWSVAELRSP